MDLISIIVPVYNVEQYLDKCIQSIVQQSYKNLEILLIDDGSTDNSSYICDSWAEKDKRIKVFHLKNSGVSHARNTGLAVASGAYIGFVDADDWIDVDMYQSMIRYMKRFHSDIHVGGFIVDYPHKQEIILKQGKVCCLSAEEAMKEMISLKSRPLFRGHLIDKLYRHEILRDIRLDEDLKLSEDTLFFWQALQSTSCISYAPQFSYHYRMRDDSATHKKMRKEDGTYLDAIVQIRDSAQSLDYSISHMAEMFYLAQTIAVLKSILISDAEGFDKVFYNGQRELRKYFGKCLLEPNFPRNGKMGLVFLSLPKFLIFLLKPLLKLVKKG
jgi:glycosyltransferase involved in cell wall biosynthesis